jgi:hypothetical protein
MESSATGGEARHFTLFPRRQWQIVPGVDFGSSRRTVLMPSPPQRGASGLGGVAALARPAMGTASGRGLFM